MSKGSTWHIWDLHLHTPFSALNNQYGDPSSDATWDAFVRHIEDTARDKGIVAIGVTDYFSIEGYAKLVQFQQDGRLEGLFLIPNIEFRIDKVVYRTRDASDCKRLNLHVLLSPSLTPDTIQEHFLDDLEFVFEQDPYQAGRTYKLKRSNLTEFGRTLQTQNEAFRGRDAYEIGCMNAVVSAEAVKKQLEGRFRGDYMLVLAEESLSLLDWDSQHHAIRKQLLQMAHAVFSANPRTREFCLGMTHPAPALFIDEFRSFKPCLWGCDAHSHNERFLNPDLDRFCWIKGDVTWEGLKQVLYEPADRVAIQQKCPEPTKSTYTLDRFEVSDTIVSDSLRMSATDVPLNRNLVAIIGGRGSGKTALIDLIASCFREGLKLTDIETSFYHRLYVAPAIRSDAPAQPIPVSLRFVSGERFDKAIGQGDGVFDGADVVYLTQNHFEEYSADPDKLNRHIVELVFEHFAEERRRYQAQSEEIEANARKVEGYNLDIEHLCEEIGQRKNSEIEELARLKGSKQDLERRIAETEAAQGKQAEEASDLSQDLDRLRAADLALGNATDALDSLAGVIRSFSDDYQRMVPEANAALQKVLQYCADQRICVLPATLPDLTAAADTVSQNQAALAEEAPRIAVSLADTRGKIALLQGSDRLLADQRDSLSAVNVDITNLEASIAETSNKEKEVERLQRARVDLFASIVTAVVNLRDFLQQMIEKFRIQSPGTLENIRFDAIVDLKGYSSYLRELAQKIDNRAHSEADLERTLAPFLEKVREISHIAPSPDKSLDAAQTLCTAVGPLRTKRAVSSSEYYNAALSPFFKVGLDIKYAGKPLLELSMGERAIILLKVLLALGDTPLLIDQPEEHLDNRFIFDDLTPAFRDAKQRRQILIATHNANLVINTDAEQIIIAQNDSGVLHYRVGTIEDLSIRESVKKLLEGGDEAFKKREERYGYTF